MMALLAAYTVSLVNHQFAAVITAGQQRFVPYGRLCSHSDQWHKSAPQMQV